MPAGSDVDSKKGRRGAGPSYHLRSFVRLAVLRPHVLVGLPNRLSDDLLSVHPVDLEAVGDTGRPEGTRWAFRPPSLRPGGTR